MDMTSLALALAAYGAVAALTIGAFQRGPATQPYAGSVLQTTAEQWSMHVDTATLNGNMNAWAVSQAGGFETPFGTARLRDLSAEIQDNRLTVRGTADAAWLSMPVDAVATATVEGGNVQVHVPQAHVNGVDLPDAARAQLEQQLQSQIAQSIAGSRVVVQSVSLTDGALVVVGAWR
jgi:hypothetical protein